ncbi:MAG TPA: DapH/DapD/GlmU-related protein [Solirubrobacteraceae bacterium]|nr:DapH/DapD/GlmU-related protein [Solirubrobacteraceae bacterium]
MSDPELGPVAFPGGQGPLLGAGVRIGEEVQFGAYVVIHDGTIVGDRCAIEDHAVLGKPPRLSPHSRSRGEIGPLELAPGVKVGAGAVVFAGASVGADTIIGDQAFVRERSRIGAGALVGRGSVVDNDVELGARARVQSGVYLTAFSLVEDDVFIGPGVVTTNDDTMGRHGSETPLSGPVLRRACRIGGGAVLAPGVEIGSEAYVAAGAVVVSDVPARAVVMGVPARVVREVPDADLIERWR